MLSFKLKRRYKGSEYTIGRLSLAATPLCDTLEDKDRGLTSDMTETQILRKKVYGKTAIPTGTYEIRLTVSPKFKDRDWAKKYGGLVPELIGVKGFSGTRIHVGNKVEETYGCPLVGENKVKGQVINSKKTYYMLMDTYFMPAHKRAEKMFITIE